MQIRIVLGTTTEEGTEWQAERGLETTKISFLRHWVLATKTRAQIREWFQLGPNRRISSSARHGQAPGNSVCGRQNSPEKACSPGAKRLSNSPVHAETREKSGGIFHTKRSFSQLAPEFPRFRWKNADYVNWDEESSSSRVDEGVPCSLRWNGKANLLSLWGILNDDYCRNFQSSARWDTPLPLKASASKRFHAEVDNFTVAHTARDNHSNDSPVLGDNGASTRPQICLK